MLFTYTNCGAEETNILPSQQARVTDVSYVDSNDEISATKQIVTVKILTGENKGEEIQLENMLSGNPYYDIKIKKS